MPTFSGLSAGIILSGHLILHTESVSSSELSVTNYREVISYRQSSVAENLNIFRDHNESFEIFTNGGVRKFSRSDTCQEGLQSSAVLGDQNFLEVQEANYDK